MISKDRYSDNMLIVLFATESLNGLRSVVGPKENIGYSKTLAEIAFNDAEAMLVEYKKRKKE